jgi:hypothetical protein
VDKLVYPPMEMFHRFIRKDHEGFNRALIGALELHRQYWSEEERAVNISGLVALAPLAMTCLAHDAGIPIEVEFEYLPAVLISRNWVASFPPDTLPFTPGAGRHSVPLPAGASSPAFPTC